MKPDFDADDMLDDAALARLRAQLDRDIATYGFTDVYHETLRDGIAPPTAEVTRASLRVVQARIATAEMTGTDGVRKLFRSWPKTRLVPHSFRRTAGLGMALGVAVLAAAGIGAFAWNTIEHRTASASHMPSALHEVATQRTQRATIQLSDGTRVTLGVASRLRYAEGFTGGAARDVYLEGDAYFDVGHDTARPFRVHAGHTVTQVLGTRFGVRAYPEDQTVRVAVAEGRVAFANIVLSAGDLGIVVGADTPVVRHGVDIQSELSWVDGHLVFAGTPVREVVAQLARWYGIDIQLEGTFRPSERYTLALRGDESPEQVMRMLASGLDARLERHGVAFVLVRATSATHR